MTRTKLLCLTTLAITVAGGSRLAAQVPTDVPPVVPGAKPVKVEHIKVHGTSLEGNLEGDAVDRDVFVFLPPSYAKEKSRRYPVVYALHGYSIGAEQWTHEIHVPQTIEGAFAQGAKEMIVVLPDSKTVHNGSMYSSSTTTGDFEQFVAHDLVVYIDVHYRTIPGRNSRGLVGHSMGGYGVTRIGMKHPDVFGSLYIMSPCCLSPRPAGPPDPEITKAVESAKTPEDSANLPFFARAQLASAAAWSPDPKSPPLYLDLPTKDGELQPDVLAKWTANAPLAFVDQCIGNLRQYRGIAIDVGDQDGLRFDSGKLHDVSRQIWHREQLRTLSRHAHEQNGRALSESRDSIFQPKSSVCYKERSWTDTLGRGNSTPYQKQLPAIKVKLLLNRRPRKSPPLKGGHGTRTERE